MDRGLFWMAVGTGIAYLVLLIWIFYTLIYPIYKEIKSDKK